MASFLLKILTPLVCKLLSLFSNLTLYLCENNPSVWQIGVEASVIVQRSSYRGDTGGD